MLARGASFRKPTEDDAKWFYAAYKKGDFDDLDEIFQDELKPAEVLWTIGQLFEGEEWFILEAKTPKGIAPVGLVSGVNGAVYAPHAIWFWWATPRNKLECSVKFLSEIGRETTMVITAPKTEARFFDRLLNSKENGRWGLRILRRVGTIHHKEAGPMGVWQNA